MKNVLRTALFLACADLQVFACRRLDFEDMFHAYDSSIDCNSPSYEAAFFIAMILVLLIPVGIPAFFAFLLYKNRNVLGPTHQSKTLVSHQSVDKGQTRGSNALVKGKDALDANPDLTRSDDVRPASMPIGDHGEKSSATRWKLDKENFDFLVGSYEPEFFWFELVVYLKKFLLAGVMAFTVPGSVTQLYLGLLLTFFFFAVLTRCMPYKLVKTDLVAVVSEAILFFTMLCSLMLKLDLADQVLGEDFYDGALAMTNILGSILMCCGTIFLSFRRLAEEWLDAKQEPLQQGDFVRILECPEQSDCYLRQAIVRSSSDVSSDTTSDSDTEESSEETFTVSVKMPSTTPCLLGCCTKRPVLSVHLKRDQMQVRFRRKMAIRCLVAILKSVVTSMRRVICPDDFINVDDEDCLVGQDLHPEFAKVRNQLGAFGFIDATKHSAGSKFGSMKDVLIDKIMKRYKKRLEPIVIKHGLEWEDAKQQLKLCVTYERLNAAFVDPESFLEEALKIEAQCLILAKLRKFLEPALLRKGITWSDGLRSVRAVMDMGQLTWDIMEDAHLLLYKWDEYLPQTADQLLADAGPAAKKLAAIKLRPALEPLLAKRHLAWEDIQPALELVDSVEELESVMSDPEEFLRKLMVSTGPAATGPAEKIVLKQHQGPVAKHLVLCRLRPMLEPRGVAEGIEWASATPIIADVVEVEVLHRILEQSQDAQIVFSRLFTATGPVAIRVARGKLKPLIVPKLLAHSINWDDVVPAIEMLSLSRLQKAMVEVEILLDELLRSRGAIGKQVSIARLRSKVEPKLVAKGMEWSDVLPAITMMVDSDNVQHAIDNPATFVDILMRAHGPVAKVIAIAKLRPKLEVTLSLRHLSWHDILPALTAVQRLEDLNSARNDMEGFLKHLEDGTGSASRKLLVAKLRPLVEPQLTKHGLGWEDAVLVLEKKRTPELRRGLERPMELFQSLIGADKKQQLPADRSCANSEFEAVFHSSGTLGLGLKPDKDDTGAVRLVYVQQGSQAAKVDGIPLPSHLIKISSGMGSFVVGKEMGGLDFGGAMEAVMSAERPLMLTFRASATVDEATNNLFAMAQLKNSLQPLLLSNGMLWSDVLPAIEMYGVDQVQKDIGKPAEMLAKLLKDSGVVGKKMHIAKLRPDLQALLPETEIRWDDFVVVLECMELPALATAMNDLNNFLQYVASGPVAKQFAVAKLRPPLEPVLEKRFITWEDVRPTLDLIDVDAINTGIRQPGRFIELTIRSVSPAGKQIRQMALEKLRPVLEPLIIVDGSLEWTRDFIEPAKLPGQRVITSLNDIRHGFMDPRAFLDSKAVTAWLAPNHSDTALISLVQQASSASLEDLDSAMTSADPKAALSALVETAARRRATARGHIASVIAVGSLSRSKVWIGKLPNSVPEQTLVDALETGFGHVVCVDIHRSEGLSNWAFAEFSDRQTARRALDQGVVLITDAMGCNHKLPIEPVNTQRMSLMELLREAFSMGVSTTELEAAMDSSDAQAAIIALLHDAEHKNMDAKATTILKRAMSDDDDVATQMEATRKSAQETRERQLQARSTERIVSEGKTIHVGGLDFEIGRMAALSGISRADHIAYVQETFEQFGEVIAVTTRFRAQFGKVSWALVTFADPTSAAIAINDPTLWQDGFQLQIVDLQMGNSSRSGFRRVVMEHIKKLQQYEQGQLARVVQKRTRALAPMFTTLVGARSGTSTDSPANEATQAWTAHTEAVETTVLPDARSTTPAPPPGLAPYGVQARSTRAAPHRRTTS
eukprot:COSAG02_NODE_2571_length_8501_cov_23.319567_3_plen_1765_part_00